MAPWEDIRALGACTCRLVALDKCPGVRPIGVGETLRRIAGKTVCLLTRYDLEDVCKISQLCGGVRAGIEGAIHAISDLFLEREEDGWGVLLIDASNAFNTINRQAALWNSRILWPNCSLFLFNTYRGWVPLIVTDSSDILYSREGVTQGDPLSMFLYALATIPLIECVGRPNEGVDVWYADDASACAHLHALKEWFVQLLRVGPSYGYHPEPTKCMIVVSSDYLSLAHQIFDSFGVRITTSHRLLGGVIGDHDGISSYLECCVNEWYSLVDKLVLIAKTQPQLAYSAFTRSVQSKWIYLQRVVPNCGSFFASLEHLISERLLPTIFGCEISLPERTLFSLPARMGGLNVRIPTSTDHTNYTTSRRLICLITDVLNGNAIFDIDEYSVNFHSVREEVTRARDVSLERLFQDTLLQLNDVQQRAVIRAKDEKMSSWLTVLPVAKHHFDLSAQEFRDALAIRYRKPLLGIPPNCDGCGAPFDLSHALSCRRGGLVTQRHNEVRDAFGELAALAWNQVVKEPVVREANSLSHTPALVADLSVRGVWIPQVEALFDIRVVDTDTQSYRNSSPMDILSGAEKEKKNKYHEACTERRALFTPLCTSVDGMLGKEAAVFVKRIAERLSSKWGHNYSQVLGWIRTRLSFSILRATILCLRGSRTKWRSIDIVDSSPITLIMS